METYNDIVLKITQLLANNSNITAEDHREVETSILDFAKSQWQIGDIKEIDCTNEYITANFIGGTGLTSGLGIIGGDREGWAICNGKNGTRNRTGRVSVAYGNNASDGFNNSNYIEMGTQTDPTIGGTKHTQIIDHTHEYQDAYMAESSGHQPAGQILGSKGAEDNDNGFFYRTRTGTGVRTPPAAGSRPLTDNPQSSTGPGTNKNMPPYIVTLFIQKI